MGVGIIEKEKTNPIVAEVILFRLIIDVFMGFIRSLT